MTEMKWQPIETAPRVELEDVIGFDGEKVFAMQWFEGKWTDTFADIVHPKSWHPLPAQPQGASHDGQ